MLVIHRLDYRRLTQSGENPEQSLGPIHVVDDYVVYDRVWPRSKKKRIRKKWAKDPARVRARLVKATPQPGTVLQIPNSYDYTSPSLEKESTWDWQRSWGIVTQPKLEMARCLV